MQLKYIDNMIIIKVDGVDYAVIEDVTSAHDVDVEKIVYWVNETSCEGDHLCSAYIPPYLNFNEFKVEGVVYGI